MKRILLASSFIIALSIILPFLSSGQNMENKQKNSNRTIGWQSLKPDSIALSNLGEMASHAIFTPDKITVYELEGHDTIPEGMVEVIPHYVRKTQVGVLDKNYARILEFILYNSGENYALDSIKVRSPRIPVIELEYKKKKNSVSVIFSFSDNTWSVKSDGKIQFVWNYKEKYLIPHFFQPCNITL